MTYIIIYLGLYLFLNVACLFDGPLTADLQKSTDVIFSQTNLLIAAGVVGICCRLDKIIKAKEKRP